MISMYCFVLKVSGSAPHIVSAVLGELACLAVGAHLSVFKDCQFAITLGFGRYLCNLEFYTSDFNDFRYRGYHGNAHCKIDFQLSSVEHS